jgi:hypothetical protein
MIYEICTDQTKLTMIYEICTGQTKLTWFMKYVLSKQN